MRRPSLVTKTDRHRDESTEPHYWDEGLQDSIPIPVPVPVSALGPNSVSVSVSVSTPLVGALSDEALAQNYDHDLNRHLIDSLDAHNALMTDAFPTESATATAIANAATPASATLSTASSTLLEDGQSLPTQPQLDIDDSDSDIDLDFDLPNYDSSRPPIPDDLYNTDLPPNLVPDFIPSYNSEEYDHDMSDSDDGGVSLGISAASQVVPPSSHAISPSSHTLSPNPHIHSENHHIIPLNEANNEQTSAPGSFTYFHPFAFEPPTFGATGLTMDAPHPPGWQPMPANPTNPQNQQPMPQQPPPINEIMDDPPLISNPNPSMLGSENLSLFDFLRHWAIQSRTSSPMSVARSRAPCPRSIREQAARQIDEIRFSDLQGDSCDIQGVDWASMGTRRRFARERRSLTYRNYTNKEGSDLWTRHIPDARIPSSESFLRFRNYIVRQDVYLAHFQLRSVLACPSRTQVFYPGQRGINRINPVSKKADLALNLSGISGLGSVISTLDANHGVLMAGTFNGEYCLKNLDSEDKKNYADGQITGNPSGITNHLQIHLPRRSSGPIAALSSNDHGFRIMDLTTEKFLMETMYSFPLNCTSVSPDGRLRVIVGDHSNAMIADADTGQILQELEGHRDFGFSCDWSDDGWTVATGFQDKGVKIWDARKWKNSTGRSMPVCTIRSEMAGVRNLRFSPAGSGQRVLVAAEEADYVNIIDAQTFQAKQTIDIFGEIGGVAFTNDGQDLNVLCSDPNRGGLLQLERCGRGAEPFYDETWQRRLGQRGWCMDPNNFIDAGVPFYRRPTMLDTVALF